MSVRGEEPVGRIELVGDGGLVATVDPDQWPVVGGNATVRMNKPDAVAWPGELLAFARAKRLNIEWTLKSGERRSLLRFALDSEHFEVGSHIPVASPRYTWDGRVVDADPAVGSRFATESRVAPSGRRSSSQRDRLPDSSLRMATALRLPTCSGDQSDPTLVVTQGRSCYR